MSICNEFRPRGTVNPLLYRVCLILEPLRLLGYCSLTRLAAAEVNDHVTDDDVTVALSTTLDVSRNFRCLPCNQCDAGRLRRRRRQGKSLQARNRLKQYC